MLRALWGTCFGCALGVHSSRSLKRSLRVIRRAKRVRLKWLTPAGEVEVRAGMRATVRDGRWQRSRCLGGGEIELGQD